MLNAATPTLQIKISGVSLSSISTMVIMIRNVDFAIVKGNADIEVDNDIISTFLTKEEADKISNGNYNISLTAYNADDEDVSDRMKVMWVKRGSMSKSSAGGGPGADLSDYYTKQEVDILISNIPGGADGFSPIATVTKTGDTATISIRDKNGVTTAKITDGADGITPHIGGNGNWLIGGTDTGVPAEGTKGDPGEDGFSPTIKENSDNTSKIYKLDIMTEEGAFTTPNLRGQDGDEAPFKFGIDDSDNYGYYKNDTGEFVAFGGNGSGGGDEVKVRYVPSSAYSVSKSSKRKSDFCIDVTDIKTLSVSGKITVLISGATSSYAYLNFIDENDGEFSIRTIQGNGQPVTVNETIDVSERTGYIWVLFKNISSTYSATFSSCDLVIESV